MKKLLFLSLFIIIANLFAQKELIINAYNRPSMSLSGEWNYIVDPYENGYYSYGYKAFDKMEKPSTDAFFTNSKPRNKSDRIEYDFDKSSVINVPGDWNSQEEKLLYYEGTVWYKKSFEYHRLENGNRLFVYFGAANYRTDVYLNGTKVGTHEGGFTPFNFELTNLIHEKDNFLVIRVDNKRQKEGVPTVNTDWWNYGGLTREVKLIETPKTFIRDYFIQLDPDDASRLKGFVKLDGPDRAGQNIILEIDQLGVKKEFVTNSQGGCEINIPDLEPRFWSVESPFLYKVKLRTASDKITDMIGFRTIKTKGSKILLNDQEVFLKGISIHEENPLKGGRANSIEDAKVLLNWAKDLGCNYVRLAHYPHNEHMVRLADKMGIMVWSEIPVYWTIAWDNKDTYQNAESQLEAMVSRDRNRAAVVIWSMANETPRIKARNTFLSSLANKARLLDGTRLISAALEQSSVKGSPYVKTIEDPFADEVDIISFNQYIGWYDGLPEKCSKITWAIKQDKPVIVSEFGAGAKFGFHGDKDTRWSEEYQEYLYVETLKMVNKIDQLSGLSPWILVDFRSPRRPLPEIQDGWNRKGLISDSGEKKKAFLILQDYYKKKIIKD